MCYNFVFLLQPIYMLLASRALFGLGAGCSQQGRGGGGGGGWGGGLWGGGVADCSAKCKDPKDLKPPDLDS